MTTTLAKSSILSNSSRPVIAAGHVREGQTYLDKPNRQYSYTKMSGIGSSTCLFDADDQFGPRVDISCRPFDFTLLFEDAILIVLPAALLLLLAPWRLRALSKMPVKLTSYRLATWKLVSPPSSPSSTQPAPR